MREPLAYTVPENSIDGCSRWRLVLSRLLHHYQWGRCQSSCVGASDGDEKAKK
ncbi:hypothetical protein KI387_043412, partial [Taxus chinensis]